MVLMMSFGSRKTTTLNDKLGNDAYTIKDSDGFNVIRLTSNGNIEAKGQFKRTATG